MINDWLKILVPVLLTFMGVVVYDLFIKVAEIKSTQLESGVWIYRLEQAELRIRELQNARHEN